MEEVFREAVRLLEQGQPCVVTTVIRTKGSTPQKPGAKLLVRKDGSGVGTLGGGCVEGDIWFAAKTILKEKGPAQVRDYLLNEELAARDGLVCGGTMYFLIDPIYEAQPYLSFARQVVRAYEGQGSVAIANLVKPSPELEAPVGAKMLIRDDGTRCGTLGSPELDDFAAHQARELMPYGKQGYVTTEYGAHVFIEAYTAPPTLVLAGGGHIAKALAPLARTLGFRVWVVDDRPQFANKERFPEAERVVAKDFVEGIQELPINANTAIVVATRGHKYDDLALEAAARTPAGYVGLVGSKRKTILIYEELFAKGFPLERIRSIHAPIGLNIGARTPEEIALSIMAEIVMHRLGGDGRPMKLEEDLILKAQRRAQARQKVGSKA